MFKKIAIYLAIMALPVVTFAQLNVTKRWFESFSDLITRVLVPLAFTLALLYFFYGIAKYIWSEGQGKAEGKSIMIWGVVALFVMSSIWGLVSFIQDEFLVNKSTQGKIPTVIVP